MSKRSLKFIMYILITFMIIVGSATAKNVTSDWFKVKGTYSFTVLQGDAKIYLRPASPSASVKPKLQTVDPNSLKEVIYLEKIVDSGWHPVKSTQRFYSENLKWWSGSYTFAQRSTPFECEAKVSLKNCWFQKGGSIKLYLNDHEIATLYKCQPKKYWRGCSCYASWNIKLSVLPDGDRMVAKLYVNGKLVNELNVTDEKSYKFYLKAFGWKRPQYYSKYKRFEVIQVITDYALGKGAVTLKPGYYVVYSRTYPDVYKRDKCVSLSRVLITKDEPFEYKANIKIEFVSGYHPRAELWVNNIYLTTLKEWNVDPRHHVGGSWNIHFKVTPSNGKMLGKLYINSKLIKTVDLTAFDKYSLRLVVYGYYIDYTSEFSAKNIVIKEYKYLGSGDLVKLTISGVKDIPISNYTTANVAGFCFKEQKKCGYRWVCNRWGCSYRWTCWIEKQADSQGRVIFKAINSQNGKVVSKVVNAGTLSLSNADTLQIEVFGQKADIYIMFSGERSKVSTHNSATVTIMLPLADKKLNIKVDSEKVVDISQYLVPGLNPVVITARAAPVEVKVISNPKFTYSTGWKYFSGNSSLTVDNPGFVGQGKVTISIDSSSSKHVEVHTPAGKVLTIESGSSETVTGDASELFGTYEFYGSGAYKVKLDYSFGPQTHVSENVVITKAWHVFSEEEIGEHTIIAEAVNEYGLKDTDTVNVRVSGLGEVDNPPTVKITKPASDVALPGNVEFEVSATDDKGISMIRLYINDELVAEDVYNAKTATLSHIEKLDVGTYSIKAEAFDTSYQKAEDSKTLTVRKVKFPAIKKIIIHTPDKWGKKREYTFDGQPGGVCAFGSTYYSDTKIKVEAIVQKGDYDIAYVRFGSIDNLEDRPYEYNPCVVTDKPPKLWYFANPQYVYEPPYISNITVWDPWGVAPWGGGPGYAKFQRQSITVMACDIKGFCTWETIEITGYLKDQNPPNVKILQPKDGETLTGPYLIKVHAWDDIGVYDVHLWLFAADGRLKMYNLGSAELTSGTNKDGIWTLTYDFSKVEPGKYRLVAEADDGPNTAKDAVIIYVGSIIPTPTPPVIPTPTPPTVTPPPQPTPPVIPTPTQPCSVNVKITTVFDKCIVAGEKVTVDYTAETSGLCTLSTIVAFLDGKQIYSKNANGLTSVGDSITIDTSGMAYGSKHTVRVVAISSAGLTAEDTVTFEICPLSCIITTNILTEFKHDTCYPVEQVPKLEFEAMTKGQCWVGKVEVYLNDKKIFGKIYVDNLQYVKESVDLKSFVEPCNRYDVKVIAYAKTDKGLCTLDSCIANDSDWFETCCPPQSTPTPVTSKPKYLPLYEAEGYVAQGGALYCALKDKYGKYHLILITNMPTVGEYWKYEEFEDPLITPYMRISDDILVIYPNGDMEIHWYLGDKLVAVEKVPADIAKAIMDDIKKGLYNPQPLNIQRS